jgi:hypothetical protein
VTSAPPARRRLDQPDPQEVAARSGCLWLGGILGVVMGAVVAFAVMPRVFDHYFGTADIFLGETYRGDAKAITLVSIERIPAAAGQPPPGWFEAVFVVTSNKTWAPEPSAFALQLEGAGDVRAIGFDGTRPGTALPPFPLAKEFRLVVIFPGSEKLDAVPKSVELDAPEVRFHPEEREE